MFRDIKLQSMKKIDGASASASLAMTKRTENVPKKKTVQFEAQSWPPKQGVRAASGTRKWVYKTAGEIVDRPLSPSNSSDSVSGSTTAPLCPTGTPVLEEDLLGDDVDKLGTGRSKRKKVDRDALAQK